MARCCARAPAADIKFCASPTPPRFQKRVEGDRAFTQVTPLDTEGRVDALAHLISGDQVTDLALANAREMLDLAGRE